MKSRVRPSSWLERCRRLESTHARGADGDHTTRLPALLHHIGVHAVSLAVHHMPARIVDRHRLERVEADDQLDPGDLDAPCRHLGQQLGGEVQTSSRRRRGCGFGGIDGLIAIGFFQTDSRCTAAAASRRGSAAAPADHRRPRWSRAQVSPVAVRRPTSTSSTPDGSTSRSPTRSFLAGRIIASHVRRSALSGSSSNTSAAPPLSALQAQPGRDHLGVVDHEQISVFEQRRKVTNVEVIRLGTPPIDQEPRCIAGFDRHLGDAFGR